MPKHNEGDFLAGYCDYPVGQFVMGIVSEVEIPEEPEYQTLYYLKLVKPIPGYDIDDGVFPVSESMVEYYKPASDFVENQTDQFLMDEYKKAEAIRIVDKAMNDLWGVIEMLGLEDAENDLR